VGVQVLIHTPLNLCPRVVQQGHFVGLFLDFCCGCLFDEPPLMCIAVACIYIPTNCTWVPFSSHPYKHLFVPWMIAISRGIEENVSVVVICLSFIDKNVEIFTYIIN
jgi:hypothetical protein